MFTFLFFKRIIRFLADGEVNRWTRRERKKWSDRQHEMVTNGQKPLPLGIGLPDWIPMEGEVWRFYSMLIINNFVYRTMYFWDH